MSKVIITGAGSGCGRGFVEAFGRDPNNMVIAIDRNFGPTVTNMPAVGKLEMESKLEDDQLHDHAAVFRFRADLSSEVDIALLSTWLSSLEVIFDIVIHCAGIRGLVASLPINDQASIATAESLDRMDALTMLNTFTSNALASFLSFRAILPFCWHCSLCGARFRGKESGGCPSCPSPTKVLVLGSRLGSMTGSSATGGCYAYRASKAAQNAIVRSLVADAPDIIWLLCHPGCVQSGLVPVKEEGAIGVEESVTDMMTLLSAVKREDSGRFMDRFGQDIPW